MVKLFYFSQRHIFTAVIAAYIYLRKLPQNRVPSLKEIMLIPEFDKLVSRDFGVPYFIGENRNTQVYIIHFKADAIFPLQTIHNILSEKGVDFSKWRFLNISETLSSLRFMNLLIQAGGFFSRIFFTRPFGKYITALGIQKNYWQILKRINS